MGTRGRKSAAQLAIAPQVVEIIPRPVAPGDLTDEQAAEWDARTGGDGPELWDR
jgi:hypothetical protein